MWLPRRFLSWRISTDATQRMGLGRSLSDLSPMTSYSVTLTVAAEAESNRRISLRWPMRCDRPREGLYSHHYDMLNRDK